MNAIDDREWTWADVSPEQEAGFYSLDTLPEDEPRRSETVDRLAALTGTDPYVLIDEMHRTAVAWKRAEALVERLEHGRKVALSECHEQARAQVAQDPEQKLGRGGVTETELENRARRSDAYRGHLDALQDAREQAGDAQAEHFYWRNQWDLFQQTTSLLRSEAYATNVAPS